MKALAVKPSVPASAHIVDRPVRSIEEVSGGKGVFVRTLALGVCGTDRSIYAGQLGEAPHGSGFLIIGHEHFGQVQSVKPSGVARPSIELSPDAGLTRKCRG